MVTSRQHLWTVR